MSRVVKIGPYSISPPLVAAPMAGVTDVVFRRFAIQFGAGAAIGEMLTSDTGLWDSRKTQWRLAHHREAGVRWIQIVGAEPESMARAARANVSLGAQIIDINMGCPAKKVCRKAAGSALMAEPDKAARIIEAVVNAVDVPVTVKMRTGPTRDQKNARHIAKLAEQAGVAAITIHGRTRADRFQGEAEYDTIAEVVSSVAIPVIANGDIISPEKAKFVLDYTHADAIMIGRAAQGQPWLFAQIADALNNKTPATFCQKSRWQVMAEYVNALHQFYGPFMGVRIARKHMTSFLLKESNGTALKKAFNQIETASQQRQFILHQLQEIDSDTSEFSQHSVMTGS